MAEENQTLKTKAQELDLRGERASIFCTIFGFSIFLLFNLAGRFLHSSFLCGLSWHFAFCALSCFGAFLLFRSFRKALELKRSEEALRQRVGAGSLFAQLPPVDPAKRLERRAAIVGPAVDAAFLLMAAGLALHFWSYKAATLSQFALGSALCLFLAFPCYIGGRYLRGLTESPTWGPLTAAASWFTVGGLACFVGAFSFGLAHFGWEDPVHALEYLPRFWFLFLAAERALMLLGRLYGLQPALLAPGKSRIVEAVALPGKALDSFNEALYYNFGIRVSSAAAKEILLGTLLPLLAFSLGFALLLSCFIWVNADQVAYRIRFGKLSKDPLPPGLHLKLPWPFEKAWVESKGRVRTVSLESLSDNEKASEKELLLWTEEHKHERLYLTCPWRGSVKGAGVLSVSASLKYVIEDPLSALKKLGSVENAVKAVFEGVLSRKLLTIPPEAFFSKERSAVKEAIVQAINKELRSFGIRALDVSLEEVHVPAEVARSFEQVGASRFKASGKVLSAIIARQARGEAAASEGRTIKAKAEAEALRSVAEAFEKSSLVKELSKAWKEDRSSLAKWLVLEAYREAEKDRRKIILLHNIDSGVYELKGPEGILELK